MGSRGFGLNRYGSGVLDFGFGVLELGLRVLDLGIGCVYSVRAVGASFVVGTGARPLIARLRQHVVPPQPPQLVPIRVDGTPPNPPQKGFSCFLFPFACRHINNHLAQQTTAEMDWCGWRELLIRRFLHTKP